MAVKEAARVSSGGGYIDLRELAGETKSKSPDDGTLAIFRIVEFEDPEKTDYGWDMPVVADVAVIDCAHDDEQSGKVWRSQRIRFSPVWVLRGHARPDAKVKLRDLPEPVNEVGDEIITRIQRKGQGEGFPVLQVPSKADKAAALAWRDDNGGDDWGSDGDDPF